jgi:hypothetical protein
MLWLSHPTSSDGAYVGNCPFPLSQYSGGRVRSDTLLPGIPRLRYGHLGAEESGGALHSSIQVSVASRIPGGD